MIIKPYNRNTVPGFKFKIGDRIYKEVLGLSIVIVSIDPEDKGQEYEVDNGGSHMRCSQDYIEVDWVLCTQ